MKASHASLLRGGLTQGNFGRVLLSCSVLSVLGLGCSGGCGGCDSGTPVPFKLGAASSAATASGAVPTTAQAEPAQGQSYAAGTKRIELSGHALALTAETFRAALEADLNADGRRDVLLVLQDERGAPMLATVMADAEGLGSVERKSTLAADAACDMPAVSVSRVSSELALVRMSLACTSTLAPADIPPADVPPADAPEPDAPEPAAQAPTTQAPPEPPDPYAMPTPPAAPPAVPSVQAPPEPPAPPSPEPHDILVRIDPELPIEERLILHGSTDAQAVSMKAAWSAQDLDEDGHTDVTLTLTLTPPSNESSAKPIELAVPMLDRPGGLARDVSRVEAGWLALADEAKAARKGQPERAYALAARVRLAHAAVCRESGVARIELSGSRGLECGASLAAGRAATIEIAGLARKGQLRDALRLYASVLGSGAYSLTANDRERATFAIGEQVGAVQWKRGAVVVAEPSTARKPEQAALAFVDENRVLVNNAHASTTHDFASFTEDANADVPLVRATDLAISLTGNRVAALADGRVYVGQLAVPSAVPAVPVVPVAPATPATPATPAAPPAPSPPSPTAAPANAPPAPPEPQ